MASMLEIALTKYVEDVSVFGSKYDFLNVGIKPMKSINATRIIDATGSCKNIYKIKATRAPIKQIVSISVIFFVPYLKERTKIDPQSTVPTTKGNTPIPAPP